MTRGKKPLGNDSLAEKAPPKASDKKSREEKKPVAVNAGNIQDYIKNKLRTKDGKFLVQESLGDLWLDIIVAQRSPEDLKKITDSIYACVYELTKTGFHATVEDLLEPENLKKLYLSKPQKADQLDFALADLCERGEEFSSVVVDFFKVYMESLHLDIKWKPLVDKLKGMEGIEATLYFMDNKVKDYTENEARESVPDLVGALASEDESVRNRAVSQLKKIAKMSSSNTELVVDILAKLFVDLQQEIDPKKKARVREALRKVGPSMLKKRPLAEKPKAQKRLTPEEQKEINRELLRAAEKGDTRKVNELIERGADVEAKNNLSQTPLMWASFYGHIHIAEILIRNNAKVYTRDIDGRTPLMCASVNCHNTRIAELLIKKGADVNARDARGRTALKIALSRGKTHTVEFLRKHGATE
jgi:hypothetical protein